MRRSVIICAQRFGGICWREVPIRIRFEMRGHYAIYVDSKNEDTR